MQRFGYFFWGLVLTLLTGACSGSDDDVPSPKPVVPPVVQEQFAYFDGNLPEHYELSLNAVDFKIPIKRSTSELPYLRLPMLVTQQGRGNQFSVRDVLFDDYSDQTQVVVNYNPTFLVYNVIDTLTLSVADSAYIHPDYQSSYTFTVGIRLHDHTLNCAYMGRFIDTEDNEYLRFMFELGGDVSVVKYAIYRANRDSSAIADGIARGEIASLEVTQSGPVELLFDDDPGDYALVALAYEDTKLVAAKRLPFTYIRSAGREEQWVAVGKGVYTYNVQPFDEYSGSAFKGTQSATLYQGVRNAHRYKILPWGAPDSAGLLFSMDDDGVLTVDGADAGKNYVDTVLGDLGRIYFSDLQTLEPGKYNDAVSYYTDSTRTYYFYGAYWFGEWWLGPVLETFKVTRNISNAPAAVGQPLLPETPWIQPVVRRRK